MGNMMGAAGCGAAMTLMWLLPLALLVVLALIAYVAFRYAVDGEVQRRLARRASIHPSLPTVGTDPK